MTSLTQCAASWRPPSHCRRAGPGRGRGGAELQVAVVVLAPADFASDDSTHLLGGAHWRLTVLKQLGYVVRPLRQADWEAAAPEERGRIVNELLRV